MRDRRGEFKRAVIEEWQGEKRRSISASTKPYRIPELTMMIIIVIIETDDNVYDK